MVEPLPQRVTTTLLPRWAWILQDALGVAFCLYMLKTIRLPTFKVRVPRGWGRRMGGGCVLRAAAVRPAPVSTQGVPGPLWTACSLCLCPSRHLSGVRA